MESASKLLDIPEVFYYYGDIMSFGRRGTCLIRLSSATKTASGATVLHHAPGAAGQQPQTGRPPALIPVDASGMPTKVAKKSDKSRKKKNRLAGVRQAPVDQQSAAAVAAVPGGYQFEAFPAPAPIQNTAGNVVQERQIDVDSETDSNHVTALPLAYAGGHEELVEFLISRGTNIEHKDKKGFTPLILAATAGHEKVVVETLLQHGAKMDLDLEKSREESRKAVAAKRRERKKRRKAAKREQQRKLVEGETSGRGNSTTPATNNRIHPREPPPTASIVVQQQQDKEEFGESGIDANSQGSCSSSDVKSASSLIEQKRKNNKKRKQQLQQAHQQQQQSHVSSAVTAKQLQQQQYACGRTIRAASVHLRQVFSRPVLLQGHIRTHTAVMAIPSRDHRGRPKSVHFSFVHPAPTKTKLQNLLKKRPRRLRHQQEPPTSAPYIKKWNWHLGAREVDLAMG
ncbi:conserved hypothetical protein [Culex quinquefasciatus]|uniref:Uncharacterized protein n=1 Tax=Culex quinquefasciatus TaxID=7176 RepID=B0WS65_CULQU|nr:conserved hypothetical protein [Culex quinquefasciatus]|eukprot:XP_001851549.1 conserved hypothetical protein [Culex quinquefasciatus]